MAHESQKCTLPANATFQFLAFVDPSQIPLYLAVEQPYSVHTPNLESRSWLENVLFQQSSVLGDSPASKTSTFSCGFHDVQSHTGLLVRVVDTELHNRASRSDARVTEVLFYAEKQNASGLGRLPTPPPSSSHSEDGIEVNENETRSYKQAEETTHATILALPLSSDLLYKSLVIPNEASLGEDEARFVTPSRKDEPARPVKKRLDIGDLFDEAADRRKKARRKGGQSISLAASGGISTPKTMLDEKSIKVEHPLMQINRLPSASNKPTTGPDEPSNDQGFQPSSVNFLDSGRFSRRATIGYKKPSCAHYVPAQLKETFGDESMESRNKQSISRIVMAGMRIYGVEQRKTSLLAKKKTSLSRKKSGVPELRPEETECMDDYEFKSIYHQTYKGTVFAFVSQTRLHYSTTIYRWLIFDREIH